MVTGSGSSVCATVRGAPVQHATPALFPCEAWDDTGSSGGTHARIAAGRLHSQKPPHGPVFAMILPAWVEQNEEAGNSGVNPRHRRGFDAAARRCWNDLRYLHEA